MNIIVGAQKDLRDEVTPADPGHVTTSQGLHVADELIIVDKYFEVSALKYSKVLLCTPMNKNSFILIIITSN